MTALERAPHRRAWSALTGLLVGAVLLSACSTGTGTGTAPTAPGTAPSAMAPSSPVPVGHRLDFAVPSGWEELDDPARLSPSLSQTDEIEDPRVVVGPDGDEGNPTMITATIRSAQPLGEIMDDIWSGFPQVQADDAQPVTVAGRTAVRSTAHGTVNGIGITAVTVVVEDGGTRHSLTLTTPTSVEATTIAAYDGLLESVSLTEPLA